MDWVTILIAIVLIAIVWKIIKGVVKFAMTAVIIGGAAYLYQAGTFSELLG